MILTILVKVPPKNMAIQMIGISVAVGSVFRKSPSITATAATAIIATKSFDCLATGVPLTSAAILVNTVSVLFILSIDEPLMTAIFIE